MQDDYYSEGWFDLYWSEWVSLDPGDDVLSTVSTDPGFYRVRHKDRPGLEYIGETGRSTRGRVGSLARGVYSEEMPYQDPHVAAPRLWAVRDHFGGGFEVSSTTPKVARNREQRKGIEAALIAVYRRDAESDLTANFGKMLSGYEQSSYRDGGFRGYKKENYDGDYTVPEVDPVEWNDIENVTSSGWAGLDWSEAHWLEDKSNISISKVGIYRLWAPGEDSVWIISGKVERCRRGCTRTKRIQKRICGSLSPVSVT